MKSSPGLRTWQRLGPRSPGLENKNGWGQDRRIREQHGAMEHADGLSAIPISFLLPTFNIDAEFEHFIRTGRLSFEVQEEAPPAAAARSSRVYALPPVSSEEADHEETADRDREAPPQAFTVAAAETSDQAATSPTKGLTEPDQEALAGEQGGMAAGTEESLAAATVAAPRQGLPATCRAASRRVCALPPVSWGEASQEELQRRRLLKARRAGGRASERAGLQVEALVCGRLAQSRLSPEDKCQAGAGPAFAELAAARVWTPTRKRRSVRVLIQRKRGRTWRQDRFYVHFLDRQQSDADEDVEMMWGQKWFTDCARGGGGAAWIDCMAGGAVD